MGDEPSKHTRLQRDFASSDHRRKSKIKRPSQRDGLFVSQVLPSFDDGVLFRKEIFAFSRVGEAFFVWLDNVPIGWRIAEGVKSGDVVEPELDDAVSLTQCRPYRPVTGDPALNVMADIGFHFGYAGVERGMHVDPVVHVLLVR